MGRPKKHDQKFKVNDSTTWWSANETVEVDDPKLGKLRISQWKDLHFRSSSTHDMSLIQVERIGSSDFIMPKNLRSLKIKQNKKDK